MRRSVHGLVTKVAAVHLVILVVLAGCSGSSDGSNLADGGGTSSTTTGGGTTTGTVCMSPVFTTSDPNGGWSDSDYYVHNNMWNCGSYTCVETLYACSYHSWYVIANTNNDSGDGAVKSYPNVHKDYADVPISSFNSLTSKFAATSPHLGIYNVAYDIWTNGVATSGSTEFMIWTENFNQTPAGSRVALVTFSGVTYDVWKTSDSHYIAFVPTAVITSGTLDILEIFRWTMAQGWLPSNSTLGQLDFGVEIVSTNSKSARFDVTDFSITSN
jgi:Glycosyl hydrolase family 12